MAEIPASPGVGSPESGGEQSPQSNVREQDRYLPIANISRIMKKGLPANGKVAKDAKELVQELFVFCRDSYIVGASPHSPYSVCHSVGPSQF